MAWEDLRNDLESVSRDLDQATVPPNVDGLRKKGSRDSACN